MELVSVSNLSRILTIADWMARDFSGLLGQGMGIVIFAISDAETSITFVPFEYLMKNW